MKKRTLSNQKSLKEPINDKYGYSKNKRFYTLDTAKQLMKSYMGRMNLNDKYDYSKNKHIYALDITEQLVKSHLEYMILHQSNYNKYLYHLYFRKDLPEYLQEILIMRFQIRLKFSSYNPKIDIPEKFKSESFNIYDKLGWIQL